MEDKSKTILIVEDDDGLLLILTEIVEELGCSVVGIQTASKAIDWLSSNMPHLMVLDYTLPDSSGSDLINRLKEKGAEVPPFIVSTGHGDEHIAVEMMKLGARDYVTKDSTFINRISIVVDRVIREIENEKRLKEAELGLVEAYQFGLQIIDNVQEGIVVYDLDLKYKLWNPFMVELTGYTGEEVIGKNPWDIFPFLTNLGVIDNLRKALKGEKLQELDFEFFIPKNGRTGWASDRTTQLYNSKGELIGLIATIRDITERKRAEMAILDSERQIRMITNNIPAFISYVDNKLYYRYVNENYEKLSGFKSHEIIGKHIREILGEEYMVSNLENIQTVLSGKEVYYENAIETKMGENLYVSVSCIPHLDDKGKVAGYYVFSNDITERKRAEEEIFKAKERAEFNERYFRSIFNETPILFWEEDFSETKKYIDDLKRNGITDFLDYFRNNPSEVYKCIEKSKIVDVNNAVLESLQFPDKVTLLTDFPKTLTDASFDSFILALVSLAEDNLNFECITEHKTSNGDIKKFLLKSFIPFEYLGSAERMIVAMLDITELVNKENELIEAKNKAEESETRFRSYIESAPDGIIVFNNDGNIQDANFEIVRMFGYSLEELKQMRKPIFTVESDLSKVNKAVAELFSKGKIVEEYRMVKKDGSTFWGIMSSVKISDKQTLSFIKDISNIKKVEQELTIAKEKAETNELKLKDAHEIAKLGSWELDIETGIFTFTDSFYKIFHTSVEEMGGYQMHGKEYANRFVHPDDAFLVAEETQKAIDTIDPNFSRYIEHRILYKDGGIGFIAVRFFVVKDKYGKTVKTYGVNQDITEIKIAENELKIAKEKAEKSEDRFQKVAESAEEWFWEIDTNGMYTYSNSVVEKILGYSIDEIVGKKYFFDLFDPDEKEDLKAKAFEIVNNHIVFKNFINVNINKNGNKVVIRSSGSPILDDHGVLIGFRGVDADITKEKQMEMALKESEEKFRLSFKTSPDSININTLEGKYVEINDGFTKITGYTEEDVIGKLSSEINIWNNIKDRDSLIAGLMKDGLVSNLEAEFRLKDGTLKTALMSARIINIDGKPHILSITRDISERKKIEDSLKTLSWAVEQSPASIVITDTAGCIEYVNRKFTEVTGYSAKEAIGLNPSVLKSGYTTKEEYKKLWDSILSGKEWQGIFCNLKKNGEKYWENALISPITNEKGDIIHFVAIKEDITEKRDQERKTLSYIVEAEERERNRFSRELHDGLGPILSTIKLFFQWLHQSDDESKRDMIFENGIANLNEAIDTIREISNNLSPRTITTFGVNAALKNFISNINQTQKLKIDYESNIDNRFNKNIEIIIYRIVAELINNTLKYANASKVAINLNELDGYIKLQYTDDGIGFDYNNSLSQGKGIGLFNIIQRINTLDGTINVVSSVGKGVNILISLPLERNNLL